MVGTRVQADHGTGEGRPARSGVRALLSLAVLAILLAGCSGPGLGQQHDFDGDATTITFRFRDGSVPPEYHRSFTLTVVDGEGTVVVDVYGEEHEPVTAPVDPAAVDALLTAYREGELDDAFEPQQESDCVGGGTVALTFADADAEVSTSITPCTDEQQALAQQLRDAVAPLLAEFDIATLTEDRYR